MNRSPYLAVSIHRHTAGQPVAAVSDDVVVEEPLEIRVEGRPVAVTMRTPGNDDELAVGFLQTEGVITSAADLLEVNQCPSTTDATGNSIDVLLRRPGAVDFERLTRHVFSASSCGLCGKATIESIHLRFPPLAPATSVSARILEHLPDQLTRLQETFQRTGGLHGAALFDEIGTITVAREDVGRHNAVDKVIGHMLLRKPQGSDRNGTPAPPEHRPFGLFVSGRVSFEIIQKALAARIAVVAAVSAPSSLAVEFARKNGQVLVGFLRAGRMNVYAGEVTS